jgi:hypothetical protein
MSSMNLVFYEGEIAGVAGATRFYPAPPFDELEVGDPRLAFVLVMGAFALRVRAGISPGPYTDERAAFYARCVLIDDDEFEHLDANRLGDLLLAGHFNVPVEQIEAKRADLQEPVAG